jgi:site-specific DNA-cytosine methylase
VLAFWFQISDRYETLLEERFSCRERVHFGPNEGDCTKVPLTDLKNCDLLKGGPPCPSWSMGGKKKGLKDKRGRVFEVAISWIIWMIAFCGLKACLLENVKGVLMALNGEAPFFERVLSRLRAKVPQWSWSVDILRSVDYLLPSLRERVLLRGLHKIYSPTGVPPCLPPFGAAHLRDFLAKGLPIVLSSSFTPQMQKNKKWFDKQVFTALRNGDAQPDDICVYGLDRQAGLVYSPT